MPPTNGAPAPLRGNHHHHSATPPIRGCYLRIVGECPGYERPQYHSWWPANSFDKEICARRQRSWQAICGSRARVERDFLPHDIAPPPPPSPPPSSTPFTILRNLTLPVSAHVCQGGQEWRLPQQALPNSSVPWSVQLEPLQVLDGPACSAKPQDALLPLSIRKQLVRALYVGVDPFEAVNMSRVDHAYPHSNLRASFVHSVLKTFKPRLWLEVGGFVGNSAVTTAAVAAHLCMRDVSVVTIDPFTGSHIMWELQRRIRVDQNGTLLHRWGYDFLALDPDGRPTIRDRFMANVAWARADSAVLPITMPSVTGVKLILSLYLAKAISALPSAVFLDSAHEPDETRLELNKAIDVLAPGGILFGDDWGWPAVKSDVTLFAGDWRARLVDAGATVSAFLQRAEDDGLNCSWPVPRVLVCHPCGSQWRAHGSGAMWAVFKSDGEPRP